ncbi:uncharacterized protein M421DRAFT_421171 [Didymella exigua CBS 183.55]|uniref:VWFA domain-containing protein n=1 Tax=Didymella exigua CBS 183.55 TaxID=1150837 RepID=A0A6A5RL42_9PLEO|nr:uncharacterized protein M421DRAFT_421171 [Didymella exigua CBS 183.55]KAF1927970.1 hypothetical protein M421DRAFT_421171 [Didymella exigua CBS 183.55]
MASWKIVPSSFEEDKTEYTAFLEGRKYFAVDDSGSTTGGILRQERAFVDAFQGRHTSATDAISLWGTKCDNPTTLFDSVNWRSNHGGTYPSEILANSAALSAIRKSDVWFLLTDGEIYDDNVHQLADLAYDAGILNVPLVFLITGSRGSTPGTANISIGISFYASSHDTLILFKDVQTGKIYVVAGKGCFAELGGSTAARDLASWTDLTVFRDETDFFTHCQKSHIKVARSETRLASTGSISLGSAWEAQHYGPVNVDLDALLASKLLSDSDAINLLADEAFDALAIACKTRQRIPELRTFVRAQKVEQVAPKLEDRNGGAAIIVQMADTAASDEQREELQQQLRAAHAANRRDYRKTIADFAGSAAEQALKKRNQLVDAALRSLASTEAANYNAEIIGRRSNRARRAEEVDSSATIDMAKLDLEAPSCKGYCLVCCGNQEIMSICFKETDPEHTDYNTSDFALNFPLAAGASLNNVDLISSQNVCFQCALLGPGGMSIYKERLTAVIPAVQYNGSNKKYINDQLYSALTARLATGAAGVAQLFMSILQNVMQMKSWAGAGMNTSQIPVDEQHEARQRLGTFRWMLDQLIQNTRTRETFNETGEWVRFPQALLWAAKDFETNGLASFAVTYPVAGFKSLLTLGQHTGAFSIDNVSRLQSAKLLHSIAAKYLADLQIALNRGSGDTFADREHWKQKYLKVIYYDFNGDLVPVDHGEASILDDLDIFKQRLSICLAEVSSSVTNKAIMHKIQILLFWLLFTQRGHCTAQTFFNLTTHSEPLAPAVLDPKLSVPVSSHQHILLSIFAQHNAALINPTQAESHNTLIPFANPFGASVLRCGVPSCAQPFCDAMSLDSQAITPEIATAVRKARTKHLVNVFGIRGRFERSDTGLPERAAVGHPPTSIHTNMHASIVREWVERDQDARRAIVRGGAVRVEFVKDVRKRLCSKGRGDIFNAQIERDTEALLPNFFEALAAALRGQSKSGEDVALYEHNFEMNRLQDKIEYELVCMKPEHRELP